MPGLDKPRPDQSYGGPSFFPDGCHFLYPVGTLGQQAAEISVASLDGKETKRLLAADSNAIYAASAAGLGHLLFVQEGTLLARPFDVGSLMLAGEPFRIADQVGASPQHRGNFSVSENGTLVYNPRGDYANRQLAWFDRAGKQLGPIGATGFFSSPSLSPDGKLVALVRRDLRIGTRDIHLRDLERGTSLKFTFDPGNDDAPI